MDLSEFKVSLVYRVISGQPELLHRNPVSKKTENKESSVVECLPSMHEVLGSILSTVNKEKTRP